MADAAPAAPEETEQEGLTPLDWVVIVAATVAFVLLAVWMYQGRKQPPQAPQG